MIMIMIMVMVMMVLVLVLVLVLVMVMVMVVVVAVAVVVVVIVIRTEPDGDVRGRQSSGRVSCPTCYYRAGSWGKRTGPFTLVTAKRNLLPSGRSSASLRSLSALQRSP